jgi:alpha-glucosidase/alpha-D-xyloside xylohydrolase
MIRALWLHHSDDPQAVARGDQFLWGRDILVSPVVEKGATNRRLYLPKGRWFDFWTEQAIDGGREIDRPVDLETMPLHVRAGAIIPLDPVRQHVDEIVEQNMVVTVYPGLDGTFAMYDDDGKSFGYRKGGWIRVTMKWTNATRRLAISLAPGSDLSDPIQRLIDVRVAGEATLRGVLFEGKPVEVQL